MFEIQHKMLENIVRQDIKNKTSGNLVDSIPNDKLLDLSKFKACADDNLNSV